MSLTLRHTPGEWDGTFSVLVRALATDLLLDGDTEVVINGEPRTLASFDADADRLVFTGGDPVDVGDLDEIEVP